MLRADITYQIYDPNVIRVGTGSGVLNITQASTGAVDGNIILIKKGTYSIINISDFSLLSGQRVFIKNEGQVNITEAMNLSNLDRVTISGDNVTSLRFGFQFKDISFRAILIDSKFTNCMLKTMSFENVFDYCIASSPVINDQAYDGTALTRSDNLKFIDLDFNNANGIHWGGEVDVDTSTDKCFVNDLEVSLCNFHDHGGENTGTYISFSNVDKYNIHHNRFTNLNSLTENHNGLCLMMGSGDYHHNFCNEYQGNSIRAWHITRGEIASKTRLFNNIVANTRKYSGFEFQSFDRFIYPGKTSAGISECFHNTVYNMHYQDNTETPTGNFHGVILDIFGISTGGTTFAWNNVGIHFLYPAQEPETFLVYGNPTDIYPNSNRYYSDLATAGLSENDEYRVLLGSPLLSGDVHTNPYTIDDFYGNARTGTPTIGAVQYIS